MAGENVNKKGGASTLRVMIVPVDGEPYIDNLEPDEDGDFLSALQERVAMGGYPGLIDVMGWVFDDEPVVYCNDEGKVIGSYADANRAIYATPEMVSRGIMAHPGDVLDIAFGPLVCVGFDPETGRDRDISDDEVERVRERFGGIESIVSGKVEALAIIARNELQDSATTTPDGQEARRHVSPGPRQHRSKRRPNARTSSRSRGHGGCTHGPSTHLG